MHKIICLNVGDTYPASYTIALYEGVKRALAEFSQPWEFICYTDAPHRVPNYIKTSPVPLNYHRGWWSKLALFRANYSHSDIITFVDLDMIPGGRFEELLHLEHDEDFKILNNLDPVDKGKPYRFGSAVYTYRASVDYSGIWTDYAKLDTSAFAGDQDFLNYFFRKERLNYSYFPEDLVASYKWRDEWKASNLGLLAFHGDPKPWELLGTELEGGEEMIIDHFEPVFKLEAYQNAFSGQPAILLLSGPSLLDYQQPAGVLTMGVNSTLFSKHKLDCLLIQDPGNESNPNSYASREDDYGQQALPLAKFYGDFSPILGGNAAHDKAVVTPTITGPLVSQDNFVMESLENPPEFSEEWPFATRNSVCFTAIQLLAYMGVSRIHIVGCDWKVPTRFDETTADYHRIAMEAGWDAANKFAKEQGIQLVFEGAVKMAALPASPAPAVVRSDKLRFHVFVPPYAATNEEFMLCAYVQKALKWMRMMSERYPDYEIHHYGHPDSERVPGTVHHDVIYNHDWKKAYGDRASWKEIGFDAHNEEVEHIYNFRANKIVKEIAQSKDFMLCFWGRGNRAAVQGLKDVQVVEPGIGYTGIFSTFKIFESETCRSECLGIHHKQWATPFASRYDTVIPNYFDSTDFEFRQGGDYLLYLGRVIYGKGLEVVVKLAYDFPDQLFVVAGPGDLKAACRDPRGIPENIVVIGYANKARRKELLRDAKALLMPTYYMEPFGGTMVEAFFSGTPVIGMRWGTFVENLPPKCGFRCQNYRDYKEAITRIDEIAPINCQTWAQEHYSFDVIAPQYDNYFRWLLDVAHDPNHSWFC